MVMGMPLTGSTRSCSLKLNWPSFRPVSNWNVAKVLVETPPPCTINSRSYMPFWSVLKSTIPRLAVWLPSWKPLASRGGGVTLAMGMVSWLAG